MNKNLDPVHVQLQRLGTALAQDVDELTDEEVMEEARELYGDATAAANQTKGVIQRAIEAHGQSRLQAARLGYRAEQGRQGTPKVLTWSAQQKAELLSSVLAGSSPLPSQLTLAARNENDLLADQDSVIEDLIDFGVIDEEGRIKQ